MFVEKQKKWTKPRRGDMLKTDSNLNLTTLAEGAEQSLSVDLVTGWQAAHTEAPTIKTGILKLRSALAVRHSSFLIRKLGCCYTKIDCNFMYIYTTT
jgi:hypothetical protein